MSAALAKLKDLADERNRILRDVPEDDYHAFDALSYSGLKELKKAPGYYRHSKDNPSEDTDARRVGRSVHMLLAEPDRAAREIVVIDGVRRGAVKDEVAAAEAAGKLVLKPDTYDQMRRVADFCRKHPRVSELLAEGRGEQTLLWKDPATGVQCKARADWLTSGAVIADWKTFDQLDDYEIERQIRKMKYHWQAGYYTEGLSIITGREYRSFVNVFIRTQDPIDCRVVVLSDEVIIAAREFYRPYIELYADCQRKGEWPMSEPSITELNPKFFN